MLDETANIFRVSKTAMKTIQVDAEGHRIFVAACGSMPQTPPLGRVASGLVRWFAKQSQAVKTAVMSGVDEGMEAVYASALRRTADELDGKKPVPKLGGARGGPKGSREQQRQASTQRTQQPA